MSLTTIPTENILLTSHKHNTYFTYLTSITSHTKQTGQWVHRVNEKFYEHSLKRRCKTLIYDR